MTKKELRKLKAGMILKLSWYNSKPTEALLLDTPDMEQKGDISLHCFHFGTNARDYHAIHSQVVDFTTW